MPSSVAVVSGGAVVPGGSDSAVEGGSSAADVAGGWAVVSPATVPVVGSTRSSSEPQAARPRAAVATTAKRATERGVKRIMRLRRRVRAAGS